MTQQTTVERIETILRRDLDVDVIVSRGGDPHYNEPDIVGVNVAAQTIAAEIDALTRERDEARAQLDNAAREMGESMIASARLRAEVERLRPAAEAWEASESYRRACIAWDAGRLFAVDFVDEWVKYNVAAARARAAAKERKP